MPLMVKEDLWEQTESEVTIYLPLRSCPSKSVDIACVPYYIKVSYLPDYYELYLFSEIHDLDSSAEITSTQIILRLRKVDEQKWNFLSHPQSLDHTIMDMVRKNALQLITERTQKSFEQLKLARREHNSFAVMEHIRAESVQRKVVDGIKEDQKAESLRAYNFENWKNSKQEVSRSKDFWGNSLHRIHSSKSGSCNQAILYQHLSIGDHKGHDSYFTQAAINEEEYGPSYEELLDRVAGIDQSTLGGKRSPNSNSKLLGAPGIRSCASITFSATPRMFPTPVRESTADEEQLWLCKQAGYHCLLEDEIQSKFSPAERDPHALKRKGDSFLLSKDYESALSCYDFALCLTCKMPEIYLNRGLCHLLKGNYHRVLEDMTVALQFLEPAVAANKSDRLKAHWRRSVAFYMLYQYAEALIELSGALQLDPLNLDLQNYGKIIKQIVESGQQLGAPSIKTWSTVTYVLEPS